MLDPLLWCRDVLAKLWGFAYAWEVYKKPEQRTYGYYVLPVLHRDRFVARFDGRYDAETKTLHVLGYWKETRRSATRSGGSSATSGGGRSPRPHVRSLVEISEGALQGWRMQLPFRRSCRSPRLRRGAPKR
ncbi:MAG TPA: hypothetical protein ENN53_03890 [Candidatus Acetothermia bacterium]|nr:hypothetical protein [Candidatus Acetothermia bacterium]